MWFVPHTDDTRVRGYFCQTIEQEMRWRIRQEVVAPLDGEGNPQHRMNALGRLKRPHIWAGQKMSRVDIRTRQSTSGLLGLLRAMRRQGALGLSPIPIFGIQRNSMTK